EDLDRCADQYQRLAQARAPLTERYGPAIWNLPEGTAARTEQAWKTAAALLAPEDERGAAFLGQQQKLRAWAAETQKRVPTWLTELRTIDKWLTLPLGVGATAGGVGRPAPNARPVPSAGGEGKLDPSVEVVRNFSRLATLCQSDHPADRRCLEDEKVLADALAVTGATRAAAAGYRQRHAALMHTYTEKLFQLDLDRMAAAFAGPYRSFFRYFRRSYWRDCRRLSKASRTEM